jgi:hypothetical protein
MAGDAVVDENAVKLMLLERGDDAALLGYSGLGATPNKTQPSSWMNALLRDRNFSLEQSLGVIATAIDAQIPKYLFQVKGLGDRAHVVLAPSFIDGKPTMISIELDLQPKNRGHKIQFLQHVIDTTSRRNKRIGIAGSGAPSALRKIKARQRRLLRLIVAHERKKASALIVADELAHLNWDVAQEEESVGPNCVVLWRYNKKGGTGGGGAVQSYEGLSRGGAVTVPTNANGLDITALLDNQRSFFDRAMRAMLNGEESPYKDENFLNEMRDALKHIPTLPDDKLR